ncbi:ribonuclease H-like domain-containing protein [Scleroderma yunnanense]
MSGASPSPLPSSNWLALKKDIQPSRSNSKRRTSQKHRKIVHEVSPSPSMCKPTDAYRDIPETLVPRGRLGGIDVDTLEVKNGESIAGLRKMVLGIASYGPSDTVPGKYIALDCEMVGIGLEGSESSLARVSIVDFKGAVVLDAFVRQRERVVDYRTQWSGVRRADLGKEAMSFNEIQKTVAALVKDRILVGHAVHNDLKSLLLSHPAPQLRDTQSLAYKHKLVKSRRPALRVLVQQELGISIQQGEHDSITDARATMALFRLYKKQWESGFRPSHTLMRSKFRANLSPKVTLPVATSSSRDASPSIGSTNERKRARSASMSLQPLHRGPSPGCSNAHCQAPTLSSIASGSKRPKTIDDAESRGQKGVSSGLSTVVRRERKLVDTSNPKEEWWTTLGGGSVGSQGKNRSKDRE